MTLHALNRLDSGVQYTMLGAAGGMIFAFCFIAIILGAPPGIERRRQISAAVQKRAKAYLNRQVVTISAIAGIIFILLFIFKVHLTAIGFIVGASCSLSSGFIYIRVAVISYV